MKFHWFNLMPWPHLPEDFRETNRSVWVDVDSRLYDPVEGHRVYNEYLDQLEFAADLGFDGIGVNEHHQNAYGMMPSPQIMAASLTRRTKDVTLLLLGQSIALYNPPTRVAEEMAMLDVMSGGRLVAGFPVGTSMDDNFCFGSNPATLRDKYRENHDLIRRAWEDPDVFSWNGEYNKIRYVNLWPRPIQKPHPPIWIPGGGSVETWDFCGEMGYNYSYLSFNGYVRGGGADAGLLGSAGRDGRRVQSVPGCVCAADRGRGDGRSGRADVHRASCSTSSTSVCTCTRASPTPLATGPRTRSGPVCERAARRVWVCAHAGVEGLGARGLHRGRLAGLGDRADRGAGDEAAGRSPGVSAALR